MADIELRNARSSDREAILALTLAAYEEYAAVLGKHWDGYRENIEHTLADPAPAEQIVAEQDGTILGTVLLCPPGTRMTPGSAARVAPEVRLLAVPQEFRGRGIARVLMDECIRRVRSSGAPEVILHTSDMMRTAKGLYQRMGFVPAPELDFHPAPDLTVDGYRLRLRSNSER